MSKRPFISPAVERHWHRQDECQHPHTQQQEQQDAFGSHPLGQKRSGHSQPAVHAHQADEVNGHVHVHTGQVMHQLACRRAKLPAPAPSQVAKEERCTEQHKGIGHSQVQHQQTGHRAFLHPAQHRPHHKQVAREAQQEGQAQYADADLGLRADRQEEGGGGGADVGRHQEKMASDDCGNNTTLKCHTGRKQICCIKIYQSYQFNKSLRNTLSRVNTSVLQLSGKSQIMSWSTINFGISYTLW